MTKQSYLTYLDFDLAIEIKAGTTYQARVLDSPAGQAAHAFTLPFSAHELELYILKMAHPRRTVRSLNTTEGQTAQVMDCASACVWAMPLNCSTCRGNISTTPPCAASSVTR